MKYSGLFLREFAQEAFLEAVSHSRWNVQLLYIFPTDCIVSDNNLYFGWIGIGSNKEGIGPMRGLLIAEKPSVMNAVKAIYEKEAPSLPFELEFAAFHGHLMQLLEPEDYDPSWKNWSVLPIIPTIFRYKASDTKSVDILTKKIKQGNYDFLVNACDAGREGEHIFWSFYETQKLSLPVKRFWVSSVTAPALKKALFDLKDSSNYDGMRQSAKFRAQLDWLVGMNFTRAATGKKGELTSIGRVQTPVLKLIVDREMLIQSFKPEDFFELKGTFKVRGVEFSAIHIIAPDYKDSRFKLKEDADAIGIAAKSKAPGVVADSKNEIKSIPAPTLYSLTELQKAANRMLKFKPDKTLDIAQKLYEEGLLTYPRTESRFLPTDMIPEISSHITPLASVPELASCAASIGQTEIDRMLKGKYVDDAGITDHHAIIPTDQAPNWASLSKDEQAVYTLVGKAFLAIFLPPYKAASSTILINVGELLFKAKGSMEIDAGYTVLYPKKTKKADVLPACKKGDKADLVKIAVIKGTTKPPDRYNPDTILSAMKNAGQELPDSAMRSVLREAKGLGTPATRADILVKLEAREYVKVEKNLYYALGRGIHLIKEVGDRPFSSAALTAEWEEKLQAIEKGTFTGDFRRDMENYIKAETSYLLGRISGSYGQVVGKCPICGGDIVDRGKNYVCANYKKDDPNSCKVWINKNIAGYELSEKDLQDLLTKKETETKNFVHEKKSWTAALVLDEKNGTQFKFPECPVVGTCPICGGKVRRRGNICICENHKKENPSSCKFWFPDTISGYALTDEDLSLLFAGKQTSVKHFSNKGKEWDAALVVDKEKGIAYRFPAQNIVGKCPVCGGAVVERGKSYICEHNKQDVPGACQFWIPKTIGGYNLTKADIDRLLQKKETEPHTVMTKTRKAWKVSFYISNEGKLELKNQEEKKTVGACPLCGKPVYAAENGFYCSDVSNQCKWSFPRVIKGTPLKDEDVEALLNGQRTRPITFTWKNGNEGKAALSLSGGELHWSFDH